MTDPEQTRIVVRVGRGGRTESVHLADGVIVGAAVGEEIRFGESATLAYWRSSMKPFQALPVVADGAATSFGFGSRELALFCASHAGASEHVELARAMLERVGLEEADLVCGPHPPLDEEAAAALLRGGGLPTRLHNNCSGKHIGMLALAAHHDWPAAGYAEAGHPVQARIRMELARWLDEPPETLTWARDGCGVPTPFLSLGDMARAYARFGRATAAGEEVVGSVAGAMTAHPEIVSGRNGLVARLVHSTKGRLLAKEGAEGVFCAAAPEAGWGLALKVADGARRALAPAAVGMLVAAGVLEDDEREDLEPLRDVAVRNTEDREVGRIVAEVRPRHVAVAGL